MAGMRRKRDDLAVATAFGKRLDPRQQHALVRQEIDLVDRQQQRGTVFSQPFQHRLVLVGPVQAVNDEHQDVDIGERSGRGSVQVAVERPLATVVQSGRIDEDGLSVADGVNPDDGVARRLRTARGDAQFLADQAVDQRRLADVGATDDSDQSAVGSHQASTNRTSASLAAACSALRRLRPTPLSDPTSPSTRHSTVKVWSWSSPITSATRYSGSGRPRACRYSCNRVFGSFADPSAGRLARRSQDRRHRSPPQGRWPAPSHAGNRRS